MGRIVEIQSRQPKIVCETIEDILVESLLALTEATTATMIAVYKSNKLNDSKEYNLLAWARNDIKNIKSEIGELRKMQRQFPDIKPVNLNDHSDKMCKLAGQIDNSLKGIINVISEAAVKLESSNPQEGE